MAWKHLGETFDIHGGGIDLVFPHHENEIAQSRCAFHTEVMANYWMHNGFLQVEGEKMSKSLGNFFTIRDLLADWPGEVLRLNMLRTQYRQPIDWTVKGLEESSKILDGWYDIIGDETNSSGTPDAGVRRRAVRRPEYAAGGDAASSSRRRSPCRIRARRQIELKRTLRASGMLVGLLGTDAAQVHAGLSAPCGRGRGQGRPR